MKLCSKKAAISYIQHFTELLDNCNDLNLTYNDYLMHWISNYGITKQIFLFQVLI